MGHLTWQKSELRNRNPTKECSYRNVDEMQKILARKGPYLCYYYSPTLLCSLWKRKLGKEHFNWPVIQIGKVSLHLHYFKNTLYTSCLS